MYVRSTSSAQGLPFYFSQWGDNLTSKQLLIAYKTWEDIKLDIHAVNISIKLKY